MTIKYRDVSHYNGAYIPTGPTCAKATEGSTFVDSQYGGIRRRTLAGGWPFLPYHFLHHGNINAQVDHAFGVVGHQPLMLDVESSKVSPDSTLADVYAFADRWKTVTGQRVTLAYIPHWYWSGHWGSPSLAGLTSRGIGLVSSNYTSYSDNGPGWNAYGGVTPVIWQYTSTPLDTNAFKGSTAALANLWAHGLATSSNPSVPVAPPEDEVTPADIQAIAEAIADVDIPLGAGFSTKTTTLRAALGSLENLSLQVRNLILAQANPAAIAAAVVAALPPSTTGLTQADIEQAVTDALAKIQVDIHAG